MPRAAHTLSPAEGRRVLLPGGYVDGAGRAHVEVALAPLTGAAEARLVEAAAADASAAELTTALLAQTVRRVGAIRRVTRELVRGLLVQDRDFLVARVRVLTVGPELWARLACQACGEELEIRLALEQLPVTRRPARQRYTPFDDALELRLPTGADQEWAAGLAGRGAQGDAALRAGLLRRCVRRRGRQARGRPRLLEDLIAERADRLEQRMRELAPDVTPEVEARCPRCGTALSAEIDLPFLVLQELVGAVRRLEEEVHVLASSYHWAERDILAMSRARRRRYIRLIEDQQELSGVT